MLTGREREEGLMIGRSSLRRATRAAGLIAAAIAMAGCGTGQVSPTPTLTPSAVVSPSSVPAASVWGDATALKAASTPAGAPYLADAAGRALYTFDKDSTVSLCNGECAVTWPPVIVGSGPPKAGAGVTKPIAVGERADGSMQVTSGGAWLYYFSGDQVAGDTKGDGVGGVWHLAKP